jgi:hypothetical protein
MEQVISNPILLINKTFNIDETTIKLSQNTVFKYFQEAYILVKKNDEQLPIKLYEKEIDNNDLEQLKNKLILWKVSINVIKNKKIFDRVCIFSKEQCDMFNDFGFTFKKDNMVIPILNIAFKNIINNFGDFDRYTLDKLYNSILLSVYFGDNFKNVKNNLHLEIKIKNLEESNYWEMPYNCLSNLTEPFKERRFFKKRILKNKDKNKEDTEDYLNMIHKPKKYVDASNNNEKNGYKFYNISPSCNYSKEDIFKMLETLDNTNRYYLFANLMVSKKLCHLVVNNEKVLDLMSDELLAKAPLFRYLMGYAWLRFYFDESIKKRNINIKDEFIFDINTASKLPVFPFDIKFPKMNPYMPIMVSDDVLIPEKNIGGIKNYKELYNYGICNLNEFKYRLNLFVSNSSEINLFNNIEWEKWKISISGSIMTACLQKQHPLENMFNEDTKDKRFIRYINEYYATSDIDIMVKQDNIFEYMESINNFFNQMVVNICNIYTPYAEPNHIKLNRLFQLHYFVNNNWIKNNIVNKNITFEYIYKNIEDNEIILLFKPFIKDDYKKYIETELKDFNEEEKENLKKHYSDYFKEVDDFEIKIHINIIKENTETLNTIKINYKYRITSPHLNHPLEIFKIYGVCQMGIVSQFHLPCVRAFYDGNNVYMTPSCISAHLTYMNIDYKYVSGLNDPMEIINKNRMRGFGTWLNETEIKDLIKYSLHDPFWYNLYNNSNKKLIIDLNTGCLPLSHKLFHPRLINKDKYNNVQQVNLDNGYNDTFKGEEIMSIYDLTQEINFTNIGIDKFVTINSNGFIKPLQKWIIEAYYKNIKLINESINYQESINLENSENLIDKQIDLDNLFIN